MTTHTTNQLAAEIRAEIEREPGQTFDGPIRGAALEVLEAAVSVAVRRETQRKAPVADDATALQARIVKAIALIDRHVRSFNTVGSTAPYGGLQAIRRALTEEF